MPIKSTRSNQCWVKYIWQICSSHQYYSLTRNIFKVEKHSYHLKTTAISLIWFTSFCSKPSISTSSWCNVFLVCPSHCFLVEPTASISSMKMMQGAYWGWKLINMRRLGKANHIIEQINRAKLWEVRSCNQIMGR